MEINQTGLKTALVTFKNSEYEEFLKCKEVNKDAYIIEEVFINNGYGLELTLKKIEEVFK